MTHIIVTILVFILKMFNQAMNKMVGGLINVRSQQLIVVFCVFKMTHIKNLFLIAAQFLVLCRR